MTTSPVSPQAAAAELLLRRKARESLLAYLQAVQIFPPPAAHHEIVARELEDLEAGRTQNLMLLMPPGSAKSSYVSWLFPAWAFGRNPELQVIAASHTADLAERFGRRVRNLIESPDHHRVFPRCQLASDSKAAGDWATTEGGEYKAAGIGGPITGRRADIGIIDDPVKSREEADSERMQARAWDWYVNDWLTRLKPRARQILVMTRWHERDLGGRILEMYGDDWKVVKMPMLASGGPDPLNRRAGEPLWPAWFTGDMIDRAKTDPRSWNALYQQEPTATEGDFFKADWIREYDEPPEGLRIVGASDFATKAGTGDFTEHGVFGTLGDDIYVLDWWRKQASSDEWIDAWCDLIVEHEPLCWFAEAGPIWRAIEPYAKRRMSERQALCRVEALPSIADKPTRARGIQAVAASGHLWLPKRAPWKADLVSQMLGFPSGQWDDGVDVLSLVGRGVKTLGHVQKPKLPKIPRMRMLTADAWMA